MNNKHFVLILRTFAVCLALSLALVSTGIASAEDSSPPVDPTPTDTAEAESEITATPIAGVVEPPRPIESADQTIIAEPSMESADLTPTTTETPIPDEASSSQAIVSVVEEQAISTPEETPMSLTSDPIWCPAGVKIPKPGIGGCSPSFDSLNGLFGHMVSNPTLADGVIWIEKTYTSIVAAELDGSVIGLSGMRNYKLSFRGGWNGCGATPPATCTNGIDIANPSEINHSLVITNWNNDVSFSDLLFSSVDTGTHALEVQTTGAISLTRVDVVGNETAGALLDNTAGQKDVTVIASEFTSNLGGNGLHILSKGKVTLTDVDASLNQNHGIFVDNSSAPTTKPVVVNAGSVVSENGLSGLVVISNSQISINSIVSTGNSFHGVNLINDSSLSFSPVILLGTNVISENDGIGLVITSKGAVSAYQLINNGNLGWGAYIENPNPTKPQPVTLSKSSEFKYNAGGLLINSSGVVTLSGVVASGNSTFEGVDIDNTSGVSAVKLLSKNMFEDNGLGGLEILSNGPVTLGNLTADGNGSGGLAGYGARILNDTATTAQPVVVSGVNSFNSNFDGGLYIASKGNIAISASIADSNEGHGIEVMNVNGPSIKPSLIVFSGGLTIRLNTGMGVIASSQGSISFGAVSALLNSGDGISISNQTALSPAAVSLGNTVATANGGNGLHVSTKGNVTVISLVANANGATGALINNAVTGATGNVSILGAMEFGDNVANGLKIDSFGSVVVSSPDAVENGLGGLLIDNSLGSNKPVSIGSMSQKACNQITGNGTTGLSILSSGAITVNHVCTNANGSALSPGYGTVLDNRTSTSFQGVTINGINTFSENHSGGLQIYSKGAIAVQNITASLNAGGYGALLNNTFSGSNNPKKIAINGANQFASNHGNGLTVLTYGGISGNTISAGSNGTSGSGYGAYLDNATGAIYAMGVSIKGTNAFSLNASTGLFISSLGLIDVNNLSATSNLSSGALLTNQNVLSTSSVTLTGKSTISNNLGNGLTLTTNGAVTIANLAANENGGYGTRIANSSTYMKSVYFSGLLEFNGNGSYGLQVTSLGSISARDTTASNNGEYGVHLDNSAFGAKGGIVLHGVHLAESNGGSGLEIYSLGAIAIHTLSANQNSGHGALITNSVTVADVSIAMLKANENGLSGLEVHVLGTINIGGATAIGNGTVGDADDGYGVYLDNATNATLVRNILLRTSSTFNGNYSDGLHALSLGTIQTNGLIANQNGGDGVHLSNLGAASSAQRVALLGTNVVVGNDGIGLFVASRGNLSTVNVTASANLGGGADLNNSASSFAATVTLSGINQFSANGNSGSAIGTGLLVQSRGKISLTNITANSNADRGVDLRNAVAGLKAPAITIAGASTFSKNASNGLTILGGGALDVSNFAADMNGGDGAQIFAQGTISLSCGSINKNSGIGLIVQSLGGNLALNGVNAYRNMTNTNLAAASITNGMACK